MIQRSHKEKDELILELVSALEDIHAILNKLMVMNAMESDIYRRCEDAIKKANQ